MGQVTSQKDPNTAFLIEFAGGFFGLLGLGYFYAGRTNEGITRLIIWLVVLIGAWVMVALLSAIIVGLCLIPVVLAAQIGVPYWSANELKKSMLGPTGV